MKSSSVFSAAVAALSITLLTSCDGLKEAMNAHVDTVARAGAQELSVDRLAKLMSEVQVPPEKEIATAIANAWIDYQLLGQSAASGDTTIDNEDIDKAMWSSIARIKAQRYYEEVSKTWGNSDTAAARSQYANGDILGASHILFMTQGKTDAEKLAAKKKAESVLGQVNSANFADMARKHTEEPGGAARAGSLGAFPKGMMVPEFEKALVGLKPGEVSGIVETQFGYHIIRRANYDDVKGEIPAIAGRRSMQVAESTFVANLQKNGKVELKADIAAKVKEVLADPASNLDNNATLATSSAGKFTAGRLAEWLQAMPAQMVMQQRMQLENGPDSLVNGLVKNFVTNDLVIRAADSAKIAPSAEELEGMRRSFFEARSNAWMQLGVSPRFLADTAKTVGEREKFASTRVDNYLTALAAGKAPFAEVPSGLARVLRSKSKVSVNNAGLERAVEEATKLKAAADSVQKATQPSSVIPMPGEDAAGNGAKPSQDSTTPQQH